MPSQCKICGVSLMDSDGHNTCVSHRSCSRSNPCPLDRDAGLEYWDSIEAIRAAALGVRMKKPKKPKTKSGKVSGKKSGITVSHEPNLLGLGSSEPVPNISGKSSVLGLSHGSSVANMVKQLPDGSLNPSVCSTGSTTSVTPPTSMVRAGPPVTDGGTLTTNTNINGLITVDVESSSPIDLPFSSASPVEVTGAVNPVSGKAGHESTPIIPVNCSTQSAPQAVHTGPMSSAVTQGLEGTDILSDSSIPHTVTHQSVPTGGGVRRDHGR